MTTDIVFCLNRGLLRPLVAAMNSIVTNAADPAALRFNVAVPPSQVGEFERLIDRAFPDRVFAARVGGATLTGGVRDYLDGRRGSPHNPESGTALNYARFEVHRVFEGLGPYVYLDGDLVVLDDIARALAALKPGRRLAAVPQLFTGLFYFRRPLLGWREGLAMLRPFNAGVYVTDARVWQGDVMAELQSYMDWDRRHGYTLFSLHTEPLMNLVFKAYQHLDPRWNRAGYGNHPLVARLLKMPKGRIGVLHWSGGHNKPWKNRDTVFAEEWYAYDLGEIPA